MKRNIFLQDAMGLIDETVVADTMEHIPENRRNIRIRWVAVMAACLCLLLLIPVLYNGFHHDQNRITGQVSLIDCWNDPEQLTGKAADAALKVTSASGAPPFFEYPAAITVVAKVAEVLPDTYRLAIGTAGYHILKLQVLDVIYGKELPEFIYYRLPASLDPNLMEYDALIMGIRQVGFDDYVMINTDQKKAECFSYLFECGKDYGGPSDGSVIPFKNGVFDESLWEKAGWEKSVRYAEEYIGTEDYPVSKGDTLEEAKAAVADYLLLWPHLPYQTALTNEVFTSDEAKEAQQYVKPFENGVFAQEYAAIQYSPFVHYTRLINLFSTNEQIIVSGESAKVSYLGERFTREDLEQIPDLGEVIQSLDLTAIEPPHTPNYQELTHTTPSVMGRYVKYNGTVYGYVKIYWTMYGESEEYTHTQYQDELYILVMPNGTYRQVERDELRKYVGDDDQIGTDELGVPLPREMY